MSLPALLSLDWNKELSASRDEIRSMIAEFEEYVKTLPQVELPVEHHYAKSVYGRALAVPAGVVLVGKIHKFENLNILLKGEVTVLSVDGFKRLKAPQVFTASAGAKRVIYAHEDTIWMNVHGTEETDVEKIEAQFIAKDYSEVPALPEIEILKLEGDSCPGQ